MTVSLFCLYFGIIAAAHRVELNEMRREAERQARGLESYRPLRLSAFLRCG